jgi:arylesterase / paraoxonase
MKTLLIAVAAGLALGGGYVLYLFVEMGEFRDVENFHPGLCVVVPGVPGGEDITIHPDGQIAYISSDDRRSLFSGTQRPGAIFSYDLTDPDARPRNLTPDAGVGFRPHGIHLYIGDDGREVLFVVNHPSEPPFDAPATGLPLHTVEIFGIEDGELVHRETITGAEMISPNDVVGVGLRQFYFTNDHGTQAGFRRQLEDYLRLPWSGIVYYDGEAFHEAAGGLTYANGINVSPDGRRLYVSEVTRGTVREFDRDLETGVLTHRRTLDIGFGVDNIEVDRDGSLWIGGHLKLLTFVRHARDATVPAPSQVVRVALSDSDYRVQPVFVDDGALLSGASVGAHRNGRLMVGSVFEPHILDCRLDREQREQPATPPLAVSARQPTRASRD